MLNTLHSLKKNQVGVAFGLQQTNNTLKETESPTAEGATTICFFNDIHSKFDYLPSISNKVDNFKKANERNSDCFVLGGGDIKAGLNTKLDRLMLMWLELNTHLSALGNHDCDVGTTAMSLELANFTKVSKQVLGREPSFKYVATNLNLSDKEFLNSNLYNKTAVFTTAEKEDCHDKKIVSSCILERNGHKYGFIGTVPNNLELILNAAKPYLPLTSQLHVSNNHQFNISSEVSTFNNDRSVVALQEEIDSLKNQGINRIILLSHSGYLNDIAMAQRLDGVDIIIGGHSHNVKPNFFVKSKAGEPVLIVQAGKNGELTGFIKTFFNKDGVINPLLTQTKLEKNVIGEQNAKLNFLWDKIFGQKEVLGKLAVGLQSSSYERKIQENPLISFIANSIKSLDDGVSRFKHEKPADVVFLLNNPEYLSAKIPAGELNDRILAGLSKYNQSLYKIEVTGADLKDILDWGAGSIINSTDFLKTNTPYPGLVNTAGLSYEVDLSKKDRVSNVVLRDSGGKSIAPLDLKKSYSIIIDENFIKAAKNYLDQKPYNILSKKFHLPLVWPEALSKEKNKQVSIYDSLYNYVKSFNGLPINISRDPLSRTNEPSRVVVKNLSNNDSCGYVDLQKYNLHTTVTANFLG